MLARDKSKLVEAATGQKAPDPIPFAETPMGKAMLQKVQPPTDYATFAASQGLSADVPVTTMGLSSEGKYGGYYSKEDLNKAIIGEAEARQLQNFDYAQSLRDLAASRTSQINRTISSQLAPLYQGSPYGATIDVSAPGVKQLAAFKERTMGEVSQLGTTAQQIEDTPVSAYARAIATRRYGMNPALAAGTFGSDVDVQAYEQRRNALSLAETGKPYDVVRQEAADLQSETTQQRIESEYKQKLDDQQMMGAVEGATGLSASRMRNLTGFSNAQMFDAIDRAPGGTIEAKITEVRKQLENQVNKYYQLTNSAEKDDFLKKTYDDLNNPAAAGLAAMLLAMLLQRETMRGKTTSGLSSAALNQMMPIYDLGND